MFVYHMVILESVACAGCIVAPIQRKQRFSCPTFLWLLDLVSCQPAVLVRFSLSGLGLMIQVGPGRAQLVGPRGPTLIKSVNFRTTRSSLDTFERSSAVESIEHATRVELSLLRGNGYFISQTRHREKVTSHISSYLSSRRV